MEAYEDETVKNEQFWDFYKQHKIYFIFKNNDKVNITLATAVFDHLKSNEYYKELASLTIQQTKSRLDQNKKTLAFVNEYLTNLSQYPPKTETGTVVMQNNEDTPVMTVASLLQQKELLMESINEQEMILKLDKAVIAVVDNSDIIAVKKKLLNRTLFILPLILFGLVSLFYFLIFISRKVTQFVAEE